MVRAADQYIPESVLTKCYEELLYVARLFDKSVSVVLKFGGEGTVSASTIVVCESKFTQVRVGEIFQVNSFCRCGATGIFSFFCACSDVKLFAPSLFLRLVGPYRICPEYGVASAVPPDVNFQKLFTYTEAKTKCEAHGMQLMNFDDVNSPLAGVCSRFLVDEVVPTFDVSIWERSDSNITNPGGKRGVICQNPSWSK